MLIWPLCPRALRQLACRRGLPDVGSWSDVDDRGRTSAQGPEPTVLTQRIRRQAESTGQAPDLVEPPQPQVAEACAASPTPAPARSQSRSYNPIQTEPDFDTLSTDTVDSLREQVRRVHQRLDEVQKKVLKSRGEVGEISKGGSPFTPEI
ncbi:hypothetical protein BHE74_00037632 [Ensete ventricosum]|nr:hypothetical protein GW17_00062105 [Ensete ventricosum]RWW55705.1 hypothetical protein BHE74_00037632 [Ensete ventricosum]